MIIKIDAKNFDFPPYLVLIRTKKEAENKAKYFGWFVYNIIHVTKRFEKGYIVGQWLISGKEINGKIYDNIICPIEKYINEFGVSCTKTIEIISKNNR